MPRQVIGELTLNVKTWNPSQRPSEQFRYIDLSSVDQSTKTIGNVPLLRGHEAPSRARQLVSAGDILVSTVRPNLNGVAPVTETHDGSIASTGFCVLRPNPAMLDSSYLMHWVRSPPFVELMVRQATGASYPAVSDRIVKNSPIPLPPLAEQRRIAAILDKADALRRKRQRAIELLDSLTQAIFLEMFGASGAPDSRVELRPLGELAELINGDRSSNYPSGHDIVAAGILFLNTTNITPEGLDLSEANYITREKFASLSRGKLQPKDIIITLRGSIGQTALFENSGETGFINAQMMIIRPKDRIQARYLLQVLKTLASHLKRIGSGSAVPQLTAKQMSDLQIPVPDQRTQRELGDRCQAVQAARSLAKQHDEMLDSLFASLQHRAFSGQL